MNADDNRSVRTEKDKSNDTEKPVVMSEKANFLEM